MNKIEGEVENLRYTSDTNPRVVQSPTRDYREYGNLEPQDFLRIHESDLRELHDYVDSLLDELRVERDQRIDAQVLVRELQDEISNLRFNIDNKL